MDKFKRWIWIGLAAALAAAVGALLWPRQGDEAEAVPPQMILPGHSRAVSSLVFFPDGKTLLSAGRDNAVRLWDVDTGRLLNAASILGSYASVSPDGQRIAVGGDPSTGTYLWNLSTGESTMLEAAGGVVMTKFSPDGRTVATARHAEPTSIWDVETGTRIHTLDGSPVVKYSPDSKRIVTAGSDSAPKMWDVETGALLHTLGGHSKWSYASYSPDGKRIVTSSQENGIQVWEANTGASVHTLRGHRGEYLMSAYYPDGKTIISVSEHGIKTWDADTGALMKTLNKIVEVHDFPPDGKNLVQKIPNAIRIRDAARGELLYTLSHSSKQIVRMAYSPDGKTISGANENSEIYIWRIEQAKPAP